VQRVYTHGKRLISQSRQQNGIWEDSFYGHDGHGDVRFLTNKDGVVTDTYTYDAFGILITSTGATPNNYLFNAQQYDPDLGLYFKRARYYNQDRGRFMTMDPMAGKLRHPPTLHKYLFGDADPVNNMDPCGTTTIAAEYPMSLGLILAISVALYLVGVALQCLFVKIATRINPGFVYSVPPNLRGCASEGDECDEQYEADSEVCRGLPTAYRRQRCWASAAERLGNCIAGRPVQPLDTGLF